MATSFYKPLLSKGRVFPLTITFLNQWTNGQGNYNAIPHLSTTNKSFLRTCQQMRQMKIKNYAFPLALYDPDLADVDVYDLEDNTPENERLRTKVQIEARRNGWYYLRECVRIYEQGGSPIPFRLDRGSLAMAWCFFNGIDYTGMQPRQTGKCQPEDALVLTEQGWIRMDQVTYETQILCPDGSSSSIIGIYPQGELDMYEITLESGKTAQSCVEHLWKIYSDPSDDVGELVSLGDLMTRLESAYIPVVDGPDLAHKERLVSIAHVGKKPARCLLIDHPKHLYITDNNIVTHNTVCALSLTGWVLYSAGYEFQIGMMAKDNSLREENVKRVRSFGENLPKWWMIEDKFKDKKNSTELFYNALRTHYVTFVAQKDKSQADKQARGASPPMFHFDEFEFTNNIGTSYPTIMASTGTARINAMKNNQPHSIIITTTAGDPSKPECKEASKILEGAMPFSELLFDIENREKLHEVIEAASAQKMVIGIFSHLQLGYDNAWLRDKINRNRMTPDQTMRDYLNRRVSIQDNPIIPEATLAIINASQRDPEYMQMLSNKFVIYWYLPKDVVESQAFKERSIIVGCDSSEMIGRDATTLVGIDPRSLETVFSFRCSEGNINVVGAMIAQLLLMYPKMVLVPENKSSGTAFIDNVGLILRQKGQNPFFRMFNWIVHNRHEKEFANYDLRDSSLLDTVAKKYFGIKTDKGKRDELYGKTLFEAANRAASRIKDRNLIQELGSLVERNGRVDHAVGSHDDSVVAWLMAMWFILNGKHLDKYGIQPGTVLSTVHAGRPDKSRLSEEHQAKVRAKIEELETQIKYQRDPSLRKLLESDVVVMKSMIKDAATPTPITADELNRDPKRFIDPVAAARSSTPVNQDEVARSLRMLLGLQG